MSTKTRKSLEAKNAPYMARLSVKGRTCNPTPLVHQYMTKKTNLFMKKILRDNSSKM